MGMGEPHAHMGSQRSHFPRHRSFFCFRYVVCFLNPSVIANSVVLRRPECTPSSANHGLDSVRISWENVVSMGEPHEHGRIAWAWENPMRIWGSQWSHFPRHRSFFCFRFFVSFLSPSAIANSVLFRRPGCTPSSANRGLDSVCISMGERREHGRTS